MTAIEQRRLEGIEADIRDHEERARQAARGAILHKIAVGQRLIEARKLLPHGEFGEWAAQNFGWTRQHLARHIRLARNGTRVLQMAGADLSMRGALRAIAPGREQRERWLLVGELDGPPPDDGAPGELLGHVKEWRVRKG